VAVSEDYQVLSREAGALAKEGDLASALKVAAAALEANPDAIKLLTQVIDSSNFSAMEAAKRGEYGVAIVLTREKLLLLDALRNRVLADRAATGNDTVQFSNIRLVQIGISRTEVIAPLLALADEVKKNAKFTGRTEWWEYIVFPWVIARWVYEWGDDEDGQTTALCLYTMIGELKSWMSQAQTEAWKSAMEDLRDEAGGEWKDWKDDANQCAALGLAGELR
jgi:hypothetical protein